MLHTPDNKQARLAGFLYLLVVISGIFSLMYVPSKLIVTGDAALTYKNIASSETLFRFWIVSGLLCYTFFLFLPLVLHRLLKPVHEQYANLMVLLAVMSVPVFFLNVQNQFSVLSLLDGDKNVYGFTIEQVQAQVMLYLDQFDNGLRIVHIFSGLWLFPFGLLVFRSGFLPKFLGVLLMLGCIGYMINFLGNTLYPAYSQLGIASYIRLPASIGEIGICLWLLIVGTKRTKEA
ncbi:MAG: DUF4386 domain-containing protein [Ferruginibacter sp.]